MIYDIWIPGSILRSYVCLSVDMCDWLFRLSVGMSVCLYVVGLLVFWVLFVRLPVCLDSEVLCLSVRLFGLWVVCLLVLGYLSLDSRYFYYTDVMYS